MNKIDRLEEILASKRRRVESSKKETPLAEIEALAKQAPKPADFLSAIRQDGRISVIAEMKRKSPSAGSIQPNLNVPKTAQAYHAGGAAALSVLAEQDWFGGSIDDVKAASASSELPVLRKDFVFDPYQIVEARAFGASAVLLIADMVPATLLKELAACAAENGLTALVEIFTAASLQAALDTGSAVIGINTRNLRTLEMDPQRIQKLAREIPSDRVIVAESGIKSGADIEKFKSLPVASVLVGESLLKAPDAAAAVKALVEAGKK